MINPSFGYLIVNIDKTIEMLVSKPKLVTGNPTPGDKHPVLGISIFFYEIKEDEKYDIRYES